MKIFLSVFFIAIPLCSWGQNSVYDTALQKYSSHAYASSIPLLHKALEEEKNEDKKAELHFALGHCYQENSDYTSALYHYKESYKYGYGSMAMLRTALMQKTLGEYDEALLSMETYKELSPIYPHTTDIIKGINSALSSEKSTSSYTIIPIPEINSIERDFAPAFYHHHGVDFLVFTSSRHSSIWASDDSRNGESSSSLYITRMTYTPTALAGGIWEQPSYFTIKKDRKDHVGASCFSPQGDEIFFTLCSYSEKDMGCAIAYSHIINDSLWSTPHIIIQNDSSMAIGHPSLSPDGKLLFFSMETTRGDKDIYVSSRIDSTTWSKATPIHIINSDYDEMFPFMSHDGKLYFSSNGHQNMGGLDIFYSEMHEGMFSPPVNAGVPINSHTDDFSIIFSSDGEYGYLASNRHGGIGKDDIYLIRKIPHLYAIEGVVIDNITGLPIDDALIRIECSDGGIHSLHTNAKGVFYASPYIIKGDKTYKIFIDKKQYLIYSFPVTTFGINDDEFISTDDGYLHTIQVIAEIDPMSSPIVLPRIEYDFDKSILREDSKKSLDALVETLEENPDIAIELRAHTDHLGSDSYNDILSERRAAACVEYLISKGIDPQRLQSRGMGRREPFVIPEYFQSSFDAGVVLSEDFIRSLKDDKLDEEARQYNRRTDFRVLGIQIANKPTSSPETVLNENITEYDSLFLNPVISYRIDSLTHTDEEKFTATTATQNTSSPDVSSILFYTLKDGDNYGTVSSFFGIPVAELRRINGGLKGISPYQGMILKVNMSADYSIYDRSHHRIERTENTFEKILSVTGLKEEDFIKLNPSFDKKNIRAGDIIVIAK